MLAVKNTEEVEGTQERCGRKRERYSKGSRSGEAISLVHVLAYVCESVRVLNGA